MKQAVSSADEAAKKSHDEAFSTIEQAIDLLIISGANNETGYSGDYFLATLNGLRELQLYISDLEGEIERYKSGKKPNEP